MKTPPPIKYRARFGSLALGLLLSLHAVPVWAGAKYHVAPKIPAPHQPPVVLPNPAVKPAVRLPIEPASQEESVEIDRKTSRPETPDPSPTVKVVPVQPAAADSHPPTAKPQTADKRRPFLRAVQPGINQHLSEPNRTATQKKPARVTEKKSSPPVAPVAEKPLPSKFSPEPKKPHLDAEGKPIVKLPATTKLPQASASTEEPAIKPESQPEIKKADSPVGPKISLTSPPVSAPVQEVVTIPLLGGKTLHTVITTSAPDSPVVVEQPLQPDKKTDEAPTKVMAAPTQPTSETVDRPPLQLMPTYTETAGQVPVRKFAEPGQQVLQQPVAIAEPVTEKKQPTENERKALEHYRLGNEYGRNGKAKKAIKEYQMALTLNPAFKDTYVGLAAAYAARRKWKDSQWASYQALDGTGQFRYHNSPIQAHYNLAVAICALGNHQDSLAEYDVVKNARHPNADDLKKYIEKTCEP